MGEFFPLVNISPVKKVGVSKGRQCGIEGGRGLFQFIKHVKVDFFLSVVFGTEIAFHNLKCFVVGYISVDIRHDVEEVDFPDPCSRKLIDRLWIIPYGTDYSLIVCKSGIIYSPMISDRKSVV